MPEKICFELGVSEIENNLVVINGNLSEKAIEQLFQGYLLQEQDEIQRIFTVKGRQPPDLLLYKGIHIVSARIKSLIVKKNFEGVQFLPVQLEHKSGILLPGYSILNPLFVLPAWDLANTTWLNDKRENVDYPALNVKEVALIANIVRKYDIFRLAESKHKIYISERLKNALSKGGCTVGCGFVSVRCY